MSKAEGLDEGLKKIKGLTVIAFIFKHVWKSKISFLIMAILSYGLSIERVYLPYFVRQIIDIVETSNLGAAFLGDHEVVGIDQNPSITTPLLWAIGLLIAMEVVHRACGLIACLTYPKFRSSIREEILWRTMHHSSKFFNRHFTGDLATRVNDLPFYIHNVVASLIEILSPIIFTSVISAFFLWKINSTFALVYSGWIMVFFLASIAFGKICSDYAEDYIKVYNGFRGRILDILVNLLNIRLFNRFQYEWGNYLKNQKVEMKSLNKSIVIDELARLVFSLISIMQFGTSAIYVLYQWKRNLINAGDIAYIFSVTTNIVWIGWWFSHEIIRVFQFSGYIKQGIELLNEPFEIEDVPNAMELVITKGEIKFNNVTFSHDEKAFFDRKNITIAGSEKVGLVGFSGGGKTTFANLILREFDPTEGSIEIDGQNISQCRLSSLRGQIIYLPQNATLFHRTIRENIAFARPEATFEEIQEAARAANAEDFILNFKNGYDTDVGEGGSMLSGGQRQRIAIARAMLAKDLKILILDEITSALDSINERKIQESVEKLAQDKTVIIIAHRLSTLRMVDRILVFSEGRIIEQGTHAELISKDTFYKKFWESQSI